MLRRHVQRVEAVPLVLDLGPFDDREPHAREDLFHAVAHDGQRMAVAEARRAAGQRDVDAAGRRGVLRRLFVGLPARLDGLLQLVGVAGRCSFFWSGGAPPIICIHDATMLFLRPR